MNILDIFKKEIPFTAGLNIDANGNFQFIELEKIKTSYFPVFTDTGVLENFGQDGMFRKKSFINRFKEIKKESQSEKLSLNSFKNKKLENEIKSALKIAGFTHVSIISKPNVQGIILSSRSDFQQMSVYFSSNEVLFTTTEHGKITLQETVIMSDFRVSAVAHLTQHLEQKHIFLSGVNPNMTDSVIGVFYQAGIKVHLQNIWGNFLLFSDGIPSLLPEESHVFIKALSLSVPNMRQWNSLPPKESISENKEESILESSEIFLPNPSKKIFLKKPRIKKTEMGWEKKQGKKNSKNIHALHARKVKQKKVTPLSFNEQGLDYDLKNESKKYLPKKKKIFLPKPKNSGIWKKVKNILKSEI